MRRPQRCVRCWPITIRVNTTCTVTRGLWVTWTGRRNRIRFAVMRAHRVSCWTRLSQQVSRPTMSFWRASTCPHGHAIDSPSVSCSTIAWHYLRGRRCQPPGRAGHFEPTRPVAICIPQKDAYWRVPSKGSTIGQRCITMPRFNIASSNAPCFRMTIGTR